MDHYIAWGLPWRKYGGLQSLGIWDAKGWVLVMFTCLGGSQEAQETFIQLEGDVVCALDSSWAA